MKERGREGDKDRNGKRGMGDRDGGWRTEMGTERPFNHLWCYLSPWFV
jgi:hypothetical protein